MKSIKQISMFFEAVGLLLIAGVFALALVLLTNRLESQVMLELKSTMETVEHSIGIYLSERIQEFERLTISDERDTAGQWMTQFTDLYWMDESHTIVKFIKKGSNSRIFEGYRFSEGELSKFLEEPSGGKVVTSGILRSSESDTVSIYVKAIVDNQYLVGRIELSTVNEYLKKIAESFDRIIIIASDQGYILTSSHKQLPFKIVPDANQIQVTMGKPYFLTKFNSTLLRSSIVILTPMAQIDGGSRILKQLAPLILLVILVSFFIKWIIQNRFILKPIREFIYSIREYEPNEKNSFPLESVAGTQEAQALYRAFHEKANEIEASFMQMDSLRQQAVTQLVESEKLSSLGGLVAGVAHEVNTPLGVCVTTASYMNRQNTELMALLEEGKLSKQGLDEYLKEEAESLRILAVSLERASELIRNFKQLAVEQSSTLETSFDLEEQINLVITTLKHEYKRTQHVFKVEIDQPIVLYGNPGIFHQIFTNLIMNSLIHGFTELQQGVIDIRVQKRASEVVIEYRDNGKGIPEENAKKVFEPFFTTKRQEGGSGLGMHIVHNLVSQGLGGRIELLKTQDAGICLLIEFPVFKDANNVLVTGKIEKTKE